MVKVSVTLEARWQTWEAIHLLTRIKLYVSYKDDSRANDEIVTKISANNGSHSSLLNGTRFQAVEGAAAKFAK